MKLTGRGNRQIFKICQNVLRKTVFKIPEVESTIRGTLSTSMRVYILGQSIVNGFRKFVSGYNSNKDVHFLDNLVGEVGNSLDALTFLKENSSKIECDIFCFSVGLHDIRRDKLTNEIEIDWCDFQKNLQDIVRILKSKNVPIIWISFTEFDEDHHNKNSKKKFRFMDDNVLYHEIACKIMQENNIKVIDNRGFTKLITEGKKAEEIYVDNLHYQEWVKKEQAKNFITFLNQLTYLPQSPERSC